MKRVLRSAASANNAGNGSQRRTIKKSPAISKPQRKLKDVTRKENKENATTIGKVTRKDVVKPLHEQNSLTLGQKNDMSPTVLLSRAIESQKVLPVVDGVSQQSTRRKLVEEKKNMEVKPQTTMTTVDQPSSKAPEKSVEVSSVTMRKRKETVVSPAMDAKSRTDQEKSAVKETLEADHPTKDVRRDIDKLKVTEAKTMTKKPVVPFQMKTRSAAKSSRRSSGVIYPLRSGSRGRSKQRERQAPKTPTKMSAVVSTVTKASSGTRKKASKPATKSKTNAKTAPTTQPNADTSQFVTVRRNRKEPLKPTAVTNDEKPKKAKEPTISNVTTRRRRANSQTITSKQTKEVDTVSDIPRMKRSQSVVRVTAGTEATTKSPPKRRRIAEKETDPKIVDGKAPKPQQPELSVNRSTASDSSDQSNGSVLPIYKRTGTTNNNTVNSVFDFESNSQENTLNDDEETQQLLAKMVRDKRASIAKPKGKRKKGEAKLKADAANRSKQIEKIRSDLKELKKKELVTFSTKVSIPNDRPKRIIPKTQPKLSTTASVTAVIDSGDVSDSSEKSQQNDNVLPDKQQSTAVENPMVHHVDGVRYELGHVEDNPQKQFKKPVKFKPNTSPTETPPRQLLTTYTGPRKDTALHQSTPVQIANSGNASPWRLSSDTSKYSSNVFSRYSEFEKSPIKSGDVTKVVPNATVSHSPTKRPPRMPLAEKAISQMVIEVDKSRTLANDLQNGFGFFDDDEDDANDECYAPRPSLPAVNHSFVAPPGNAFPKKPPATLAKSPKKSTKPSKENATTSSSLFKMPQMFNPLLEKVQQLRDAKTSVSSFISYPKTQTKISTHFGDSSKPSSSRGSKITVNKIKAEQTQTKKSSVTETTSESYIDKDALSLFETSWLSADDKPHRSYSRMPKRENKRQYDYKSIITDDESECGDSVVQKRTKRTKPKDDKHQDELRQFEEKWNSDFMEVDKFEMIKEKSVSISN